ncbi:atherin-like [Eumetopias jubatus]|uniref:atherin-like n=1 Tax=Eumetopias jubatus TaxID=34886 RepID=UPI0010162A1D|nr:atherin-like [Eumetopias jubatus]
MPVPGRRSPGATRAPLGACALLPRRGPALSPPTHPGSHCSPIPARARVTPTTAGWRCASTCAPGSRHLRPRAPRAPGPADSLSPEVPPSPPRDGPPAPAELRTRTPAVVDGPAPAAWRPASPPRRLLLSPRPRAQPHDPSPPRRAGELCRAAAAAAAATAAAHYHRPARAAAALKRRRQPHRRRPTTGPVIDPYHRFERN